MNMLSLSVVLKALIEIAGLALLGQGVLYLLSGAKREQNIFYQVLSTMTRPIHKAVRFVAPRFIVDQHIGALAFLILLLGWYFLLLETHRLCLDNLEHPSCGRLAVEYVHRCEAGLEQACRLLESNGLRAVPVN